MYVKICPSVQLDFFKQVVNTEVISKTLVIDTAWQMIQNNNVF